VGKENERPSARRKYILKSVVIIGPNGQLGTDLVKTFGSEGWKVLPITHQDLQVESLSSVRSTLQNLSPDWIINTAAFHKVDECEKDPEKAWLINATGPANVAEVANEIGAKSVFISSDYVFSGDKEVGDTYSENDPVSPVNAYGHSKAAGEIATLSANQVNLVFRISSVFGAAGSSGKGGNFVETIIKKAQAGDPIKVVDDMYMSPTYTVDVSSKILRAITDSCSGLYHASNSGFTSWFNFACKILEIMDISATLASSKTDANQSVIRPSNSALNVSKIEQLIEKNPSWEDALQRYLIEKGYLK
jgi:dTDP-4-dehydrorhamnose reductase